LFNADISTLKRPVRALSLGYSQFFPIGVAWPPWRMPQLAWSR